MTNLKKLEIIQETLGDIFTTLSEELTVMNDALVALSRTCVDDVDMRRPSEFAFRLFVSGWAKDHQERMTSLVEGISTRFDETIEIFSVMDEYGEESI